MSNVPSRSSRAYLRPIPVCAARTGSALRAGLDRADILRSPALSAPDVYPEPMLGLRRQNPPPLSSPTRLSRLISNWGAGETERGQDISTNARLLPTLSLGAPSSPPLLPRHHRSDSLGHCNRPVSSHRTAHIPAEKSTVHHHPMPIRATLVNQSTKAAINKLIPRQSPIAYRTIHSTMSSSFKQNPHKLLV